MKIIGVDEAKDFTPRDLQKILDQWAKISKSGHPEPRSIVMTEDVYRAFARQFGYTDEEIDARLSDIEEESECE